MHRYSLFPNNSSCLVMVYHAALHKSLPEGIAECLAIATPPYSQEQSSLYVDADSGFKFMLPLNSQR